MKAHNKNDQTEVTLDLFEQMKSDGVQPDPIIYVLVLNACANLGIISISEAIDQQVPDCLLANLYIKNALIDMWVRLNRNSL